MKKKFFLIATLLIACFQTSWSRSIFDLNIFNHLGVGVHAATTGFGFEVATPVTNFVTLRAGASFMPGFSFSTSFDGEYSVPVSSKLENYNQPFTIDAEATLKRAQGSVIFNVYPFASHSSFFVAAGGYFGGSQIIGISGHSNELAGKDAFVEIGDFELPVDANGNINGSLRGNSFRPYLGLGFGRPVPKGRVNVGFEMGVQFMGKTKIYNGKEELKINDFVDDDNDWSKWMDKITVYPVIKLTISGRIL